MSPPQGKSAALYLRLLRYVKPYWQAFVAAIFFVVVLALTEPAIPSLLKPLLDGTFVERDPDYLFWSPILLMLLFLVRGASNFLSRVAFNWVGGKVVLDLRREMFERLLVLPAAYFDANATGNVIAKVTYDVTQVTNAATKVLTVLVRDSVAVAGLLLYMLWLNWEFTLIVSILLPVMLGFVRFIARRIRRASQNLQRTMGELTHALEETVRGNRIVKVYGAQEQERMRFNKLANWVRRYYFKSRVADATGVPVVEFIGAVMIAVLIYAGTGQAGVEPMSVGAFVSFFAAMGMLFSPIKRLTAINQPLQSGLAGAESVFELIDQTPEMDGGDLELEKVAGEVRFEEVRFRYPQSAREALRGVSFQLPAGRTVALVGASGSGKTTIAALLPRFYDPTEGRILLDGVDLRRLKLADLRRHIAYVGQESLLFNDTVAANIAYGETASIDPDRLRRAAEAAHALEFIEQLPHGFDTLVGEDGVRLSGGQRQRIAIARAFYKDAPLLILDEATSALDAVSEQRVQAALRRLAAGRTTLVIAHRFSTIEHADLILVLRNGQIVESGDHERLMARDGEYANLYRRQALA